MALGRCADGLADTAFYIEGEQARRYKTLTGVDLGHLTGDDGRFQALDRDYEPEVVTRPFDQDDEEDEFE